MLALLWIALEIVIGEESLLPRSVVPLYEPKDDDVDVRHAASIRSPGEGPVGKGNIELTPIEQKRPKLCDLLTLCDGVGRHKADPRRAVLHVFTRY